MSRKFGGWDDHHFDMAEIQMCLSCSKPRCNNCAESSSHLQVPRNKVDADQLVAVYNSGMSITEMAKALGLTRNTMRHRLDAYGLKAANPRKQITVDFLRALAPRKKMFLVWKGEPL